MEIELGLFYFKVEFVTQFMNFAWTLLIPGEFSNDKMHVAGLYNVRHRRGVSKSFWTVVAWTCIHGVHFICPDSFTISLNKKKPCYLMRKLKNVGRWRVLRFRNFLFLQWHLKKYIENFIKTNKIYYHLYSLHEPNS